MIDCRHISFMAIPGVRIDQADIIWTPSTIIYIIEKEFQIEGQLFFKSRSPKYSFPRFLLSYILINKLKLSPEIIDKMYGIKHDLVWHGCKTINNMLDTKTPRNNYMKCVKIIQRIKKWDISEVLLHFESIPITTTSHAVTLKNILEHSMEVAHSTRQQ